VSGSARGGCGGVRGAYTPGHAAKPRAQEHGNPELLQSKDGGSDV